MGRGHRGKRKRQKNCRQNIKNVKQKIFVINGKQDGADVDHLFFLLALQKDRM
jgi:hypothetical protein